MYSTNEINEVLQRALAKYMNQHRILSVKWQGTTYNIDISEVAYIEAYYRRIIFRTIDTNVNHECNGSLDEYERDLYLHDFLRCHRNILVNMKHIRRIENTYILTKCNRKVKMSDRKR